jgi:hypothetical protein
LPSEREKVRKEREGGSSTENICESLPFIAPDPGDLKIPPFGGAGRDDDPSFPCWDGPVSDSDIDANFDRRIKGCYYRDRDRFQDFID